jgi:O-antigen/teichoic acid export membrane protein
MLIVNLFFAPWYHVDIGGLFSEDRTALEPPLGWAAVLAWLVTLALLAQVVIPRLTHEELPRLSMAWSRIAVIEGVAVFGLVLIKLLATPYLGFGAWIGILLAGTVAYGSVLSERESTHS